VSRDATSAGKRWVPCSRLREHVRPTAAAEQGARWATRASRFSCPRKREHGTRATGETGLER